MDVFSFRDRVAEQYARFSRSFATMAAADIKEFVEQAYAGSRFWPSPTVQLNPSFVRGGTVEQLVAEGLLHQECARIFRLGKEADQPGVTLPLHKHQEEAVRIARSGASYVLTTGTGSGKSLSYFVPIVDRVLRAKEADAKREPRISAIVVYPMNALCNSQMDELEKFLRAGFPTGAEPVRFARYTGQETQAERDELARRPPDILLTNYMMLELILTRQNEVDKAVVRAARGLDFLVLDELHTYRGRQGADVALLVRRVREALNIHVQTVGTSATMVSDGDATDRRRTVAEVASRLFGARVQPEHVVTETLERVTPLDAPVASAELAAVVHEAPPERPAFDRLRTHPLAAWIELNLGLEREDGKWVRLRRPRSMDEATRLLAEASGSTPEAAGEALKRFLLLAYRTRNAAGRSLFAFRLHQFIAGAGDLFGTLEPAGRRYLTLNGQQFQPQADREKRLFSFCFCRECGQEYLPVWAFLAGRTVERLEPRELTDRAAEDDDTRHGFFMPDPAGRFDPSDVEATFPEDWLQWDGFLPKLKPTYRKLAPVALRVNALGVADDGGMPGWLIPGSFRFCLNPDCRVSYDGSVRSDLGKLSSLSTEGRSSATTVLSLAVLRFMLHEAEGLPERAKKLLGFTDNRQDASLQAGHFNDFVQILLLRGALLAAIEGAGDGMLTDDTLTQRVFEQLQLREADFASDPGQKGIAAEETRRALRDVLGYRLYHDLRRGWRITNPNLEQLGLLAIGYRSLEDCCRDEEMWSAGPDLLAHAAPEMREAAACLLLDTLRRQLCVKTRYLDRQEQEQIRNRSHTRLKEPWGLSEDERLEAARVFVPLPKPPNWRDELGVAFGGIRSRLGRRLTRPAQWGGKENPDLPEKFTVEVYEALLGHLLQALRTYGFVEPVAVHGLGEGYRLNAQALEWKVAGSEPSSPAAGLRRTENTFFRDLYREVADSLNQCDRLLHGLEAREHTAQVEAEEREERENRFRRAELPILYCSPTMELGVDIAELNTVLMRNVPPTPANYAQRSGRAGRSGQPALVVTYAAARSPHDQYFFREPTRMVAGSVKPPSLDLGNEDLIRSHLHALWLSETGQRLANSVAGVVDLEKADDLPVLGPLRDAMDTRAARERSIERGRRILAMLEGELTSVTAPWYGPDWLERTMHQAYAHFDAAFDRWRSLFKATSQQMTRAHKIMSSPAASPKERDEAKRRHDDAYVQQKLLLDSGSTLNSDFYTYRYLASQGFLPGYNFPRLPLLAFVPARRERVSRDSFLSRPRFLALSEFGPRSIIYHEGSQYRVHKAILTVRDEDMVSVQARLPTREALLCPACGYGHFAVGSNGEERCMSCGTPLEGGLKVRDLYRIDNVSTRRVTRITSDEEERQRQGFETLTTLQYGRKDGALQVVRTAVVEADEHLLELHYGQAATVWRLNLGWRRRKVPAIHGFNIDVVTGRWAKDSQAPADVVDDDAGEGKVIAQRIVPFVEDRRNVLVLSPKRRLDAAQMATLQVALKRGIEREFQLEEAELVAEPLPDADHRNAILFYEAAEGGAGVLTRLATDPAAIRRVAARALDVCHFERTGAAWDVGSLRDTEAGGQDACEAGCYRCLLSYYNQTEHVLLDRHEPAVLDMLCRLTRAEGRTGTEGRTADAHFDELWRLSGSTLERAWLETVRERRYRLPDRAQRLLEQHGTRPDFEYGDAQALIYIDGPHHAAEAQKRLDDVITERLEDDGYTVIRFGGDQVLWPALFAAYPDLFGKGD